jgi:hypothetical protein
MDAMRESEALIEHMRDDLAVITSLWNWERKRVGALIV